MTLQACFRQVAVLTSVAHRNPPPLFHAPLRRPLREIDRLRCRIEVRWVLVARQKETGRSVKRWLDKGCRALVVVERILRLEIGMKLDLAFVACVMDFSAVLPVVRTQLWIVTAPGTC